MTPSERSAIVRTHPTKILIWSPQSISEVILCLPAVQRLQEHEPDAQIGVLCPVHLQALWNHNPHIREVITDSPSANIPALRARQYEVAILFPDSVRVAWDAWRAGIPRRVGFAGRWRRQLLTDVVTEPKGSQPVHKPVKVDGREFAIEHFPSVRHLTHHYLDLVSHLGGNPQPVPSKLWVAAGDIPTLHKFLSEGTRPFFAIHPGGQSNPSKRWLPERFAEVARQVSAEIPCRWLILGGPSETDIAGKIETALRPQFADERAIVNVAGKTSLAELCELLKFCRLLITTDTGPMHLADALGTPLVAVFGPTAPALTGPSGKHSRVVQASVECSPCYLKECPIDSRCMDRVTAEQVATEVIHLWAAIDQSHGHN